MYPGELSTACHVCGKKFLNEANMRKHLRFHSGRNFPCKYGCDVVYPNVAELVKHLRALHPELPKKSQQVSTKAADIQKKRRGRQAKSSGQLMNRNPVQPSPLNSIPFFLTPSSLSTWFTCSFSCVCMFCVYASYNKVRRVNWNHRVCVCVLVYDELCISFCFCKCSGLLRDGNHK